MGAAVRDLLGQAGTLLFQSLPGRGPGGGSDPGSLSAGTAEPGALSTALQSGSARPGCLPLHGISTATSSAGRQRRSSCSAPFSRKRTVLNRIPRWTQWKPPVCWLCSPRKNGGCSPCAIQRATMPAKSVSCSVSRPARSAAALPRYAIASKLNLRRIK